MTFTDVVKWTFEDRSTNEKVAVPINPNKMSTPTQERNITWAWGSFWGHDRMRGMQNSPTSAPEWTFSGVLFDKAHYDLLVAWTNRLRVIRVTDHLLREFDVVIQRFDPVERRTTAQWQWRSDYTMTCLLLKQAVMSPDVPEPPSPAATTTALLLLEMTVFSGTLWAGGTASLSLSAAGFAYDQSTLASGTGVLSLSAAGGNLGAFVVPTSATLSLSATGGAQGSASGLGSLSLSATGSAVAAASGSASGTASMTLTGAGSAGAGVSGSGSLLLSATGSWTTTGSAALSLSAAGNGSASTTSTASMSLSAAVGAGVAAVASSSTASLTLGASGSAGGSTVAASGTASLTLGASSSIGGGVSAWVTDVTADAPILWWRLDETSGTTAADNSGHSNSGTYVGSPTLGTTGLITGDSDTAITLNGTSQRVEGPSAPTGYPSSAITVEAVFQAGATLQTGVVFSKASVNDTFGTTWSFYLYLDSTGYLEGALFNGSTQRFARSATGAIVAGTKYVVALRGDTTSVDLLINGVQVATTTGLSGALNASSTVPVVVGDWWTPLSHNWFKGVVDEALIFPTKLSNTRLAIHAADA